MEQLCKPGNEQRLEAYTRIEEKSEKSTMKLKRQPFTAEKINK